MLEWLHVAVVRTHQMLFTVCGEYFVKSADKRQIERSSKFYKAYKAYFGVHVGDQGRVGSCQVSVHRKHDLAFSKYFVLKNNLCYCIDVQGLELLVYPVFPMNEDSLLIVLADHCRQYSIMATNCHSSQLLTLSTTRTYMIIYSCC